MIWAEDAPEATRFDWRTAPYLLDTPVVEVLFGEVAKPHRVRDLELTPILDWAGAVLNRVARAEFFRRFEREHAITYFYEPFLQAYDPELRDRLGVWYTPPEIVHYQVGLVHRLLQSELGLADGLADPRVVVLDPCVGTGSYLLEVARTILQTHREKGEGGQATMLTRQALLSRVIGFEILTAPFVIAHLQLGRLLADQGAALSDKERLPIYLTNALTGWQETEAELQHRIAEIAKMFPELSAELAEAEQVKRSKPVMVILGNPPYNAYYGVGQGEEAALVEPYKAGLNTPEEQGGWGIKKFNLDDLYVRFFRLAERQISEAGLVDRGVVSFISNYSWTKKDSFVVMREHMLGAFQQIWLDSLNGDKYETGKRTPDGRSDQSVFTTESSPEGIQVGTAIATMVRLPEGGQECQVCWRESWGLSSDKRRELVESLDAPEMRTLYREIRPRREFKYVLKPVQISDEYLCWPMVTELAEFVSLGLNENRYGSLMTIERAEIEQRMTAYFDPSLSEEKARERCGGLLMPVAGYAPQDVRRRLLGRVSYDGNKIERCVFRPLDHRWAYVEAEAVLWNRSRPALQEHFWPGNRALATRAKGTRVPDGVPGYVASCLADQHSLISDAYLIPFDIRDSVLQGTGAAKANLSPKCQAYLCGLCGELPEGAGERVFLHAMAICAAARYLEMNADGVAESFPRIPMPAELTVLDQGRALGERVADLLDPDKPVAGVTTGKVRAGLRGVGYLRETYANEREREVTVSYMGTGRVLRRQRTAQEWADLEAEAHALGLTRAQAVALLGGEETYDVVWNTLVEPNPRWENVPIAAWEYYIGGYPVLKKWLSYRQANELGRALSNDELRLFRDLARRVTALILMGPELDAHYEASKACAVVWHERNWAK